MLEKLSSEISVGKEMAISHLSSLVSHVSNNAVVLYLVADAHFYATIPSKIICCASFFDSAELSAPIELNKSFQRQTRNELWIFYDYERDASHAEEVFPNGKSVVFEFLSFLLVQLWDRKEQSAGGKLRWDETTDSEVEHGGSGEA